MSHRTLGLYRILERPAVYECFQKLLGAHAARTRFVEEFLRPFSGARLLDIGCGTGSLLDYLPAGVSYTGFDLNPGYVDSARQRYGTRGVFFCARVGEEPTAIEEGQYDLVVGKSILHHLQDDDAHHLLDSAHRYLRPGGAFVSIDPVFHDGQSRVARLLISMDRGSRVRSADEYRFLAEMHFANVEASLLTGLLLVPYSHFVLRATRRA